MTDAVAEVLEALTRAVEQARAMPMSSTVLVNRAEILDLIAQLRQVLPAQLADAGDVLAGRDEVLTRARAEAEEVLATARRRADELVGTEQVVVVAQARAAELLSGAERTAEQMRREGDDYCDRRLADFEIDRGRVLAQVQAGRAKLAGRLGEEP